MPTNLAIFGLLFEVSLLTLTAPAAVHGDTHGWSVGAAAVVITPDEPLWMGGYASRKKPSEGKVHDLFAKAISIRDRGGNRCVILTTDLLCITPELRSAVESGAQKKFQISANELLINASHTHCGPEIRDELLLRRGGGAEFAAKARLYTRDLAERLINVIGLAIENTQPCTLHYSFARAGFAMNRRFRSSDRVINSPNPDGPVDHRVPVLHAVTRDGKLSAVVFGYACHNTTLSFQQFCGDYAGYAQEYIQENHPGTIALFVAGCGGDQNPYPRRTLDLAKQHGRSLANAVEVALETKSATEISGRIEPVLENVELEFKRPPSRATLTDKADQGGLHGDHAKRLLTQLDRDGKIETKYRFPVQVVKIGDQLTLVALSGEAVVDYSLRLQRELQSPQNTVWVAGYSNHVFGYLPSRRVLEEGGYEGGQAMLHTDYPGPFAPSVEDRVIDKVKNMIARKPGHGHE